MHCCKHLIDAVWGCTRPLSIPRAPHTGAFALAPVQDCCTSRNCHLATEYVHVIAVWGCAPYDGHVNTSCFPHDTTVRQTTMHVLTLPYRNLCVWSFVVLFFTQPRVDISPIGPLSVHACSIDGTIWSGFCRDCTASYIVCECTVGTLVPGVFTTMFSCCVPATL